MIIILYFTVTIITIAVMSCSSKVMTSAIMLNYYFGCGGGLQELVSFASLKPYSRGVLIGGAHRSLKFQIKQNSGHTPSCLQSQPSSNKFSSRSARAEKPASSASFLKPALNKLPWEEKFDLRHHPSTHGYKDCLIDEQC